MNFLSLNGPTIFKRTHALVQRQGLQGLYRNSRSFVSSTQKSVVDVCKLCGGKLKLLRSPGRSKFIRFKATNVEVEKSTKDKLARLLSLAQPERRRIGGMLKYFTYIFS